MILCSKVSFAFFLIKISVMDVEITFWCSCHGLNFPVNLIFHEILVIFSDTDGLHYFSNFDIRSAFLLYAGSAC
jgi:hypothetical protein